MAINIYIGLAPKEIRKFANEYARVNDITRPPTWISREMLVKSDFQAS